MERPHKRSYSASEHEQEQIAGVTMSGVGVPVQRDASTPENTFRLAIPRLSLPSRKLPGKVELKPFSPYTPSQAIATRSSSEPRDGTDPFYDEPLSEEIIPLLNTISMFTVQPGKEVEQQDIFINTIVEDITRLSTMPLYRIAVSPEKYARTEERKIIASTANGAFIAGSGDMLSGILRYTTNILMTHIVSQSSYGIFVAISTSATIIGGAAKLGLDSAILRFLSVYRVKGQHNFAVGVARFAVWVTLLFGCVCGVVFYLFSSTMAYRLFHSILYDMPLKETALLIPLIALQFVLASGLQALRAIKRKVFVDRLIQPVLTLILIGVFYQFGLRLDGLIFATICGYLASIIAGQLFLGKAVGKFVGTASARYEPKTWMLFSFPMFFNSIIRNLLNSTDVLFLAAFTVPALVGLYGAADRVTLFVVMPEVALSVIFSSVIAEYHTRGQHKQLTDMFRVVTKWSFSLSLPMFLCCLIFHDAIMGIFGKQYIAASGVLIILAFGNLVDSGVGLVGQILSMTGRPRLVLANTLITIVINVGLAFLLVPRFTVIGAAIAAASGVIVFNVLGLCTVYWTMRIQPYRWDFLKPVVAGAAASGVGLLLLRFVSMGYGHLALFGTLGLILPFTIVYFLVLTLLRFNPEDIVVFETVRAKFSNKKKETKRTAAIY